MEEYSKNGRKLRPRKANGGVPSHRAEGPAYSTASDFRSERPARNSYDGRPHKSYGSYGDRPQRPHSEHSQGGFNSAKPYHKPAGKPSGKPTGKPFAKAAGKPSGKAYGKPTGKPAGKKFNKASKYWSPASEAGIDRMISRRPLVASQAEQFSDNDYVKTPIQEEVRLNKFIANSGVCSRREADTLIQAGVVTVNGEVVTELGTKVNIYKDEIKFNGEKLKGEEKVYLVMNKPKGYVTTASDPHADKTVMDLLKGCRYRVFPVGRLDKNTTGVLMFTNDGEIAERLTHPSYDKKKIYQVSLNKPLAQEDYDSILAGVLLSDGEVRADELEYIDAADHRKLGIEIHSGKNRIVRRIFESLGYEVKALDRVYFAGLTKKGLKKGEWRQLTEGEVNILKMGAYV